jgi:hypothetical protein
MAAPPNSIVQGSLVYPGSGDFIYGYQGGGSTAFYRYSISGNTWTTMAVTPGPISSGGSLVYPGSGDFIYGYQGGGSTAFYRYSISGNTWTTMAVTPAAISHGGFLVYPSAGDYIYGYQGGWNTGFYRYSISGNSWATMTAVPVDIGSSAALAYPGSGDFLYGTTGHRYSISSNSWTDELVAKSTLSSLVYPGSGDYLYAGSGSTLARYSLTESANPKFWEQVAVNNNSVSVSSQNGNLAVSTGGDYVYAASGYGTAFYRYSISGKAWTAMAPTPGSLYSFYGGSLVYPGSGDFLYLYQGNNTNNFYRYSISGNSWTTMTATPGTISSGSALVYPGSGDYIYGYQGGSSTAFYRYSISGNSWTTMAMTPAAISHGGFLVYPGSGDYIYGLKGGYATTFYRYSISGDIWTTMAEAPGGMSGGSSLVYPSTGDYLYVYRVYSSTNANALYRYSISGNAWDTLVSPVNNAGSSLVYPGSGNYLYTFGSGVSRYRMDLERLGGWTSKAATPAAIFSGGSLVYPGSGDYLYGYRGNSTDFYRYSISNDTWTTMAATPRTISYGALVYPGSGDYLYGYRGNSTDFYRYSISNDTWTTMAATPGTIGIGASLAYPGSGDYIYGYQGGSSTAFYRYSISGNSWATMAMTPSFVSQGGSLVSPGSGDYLYGFQLNNGENYSFYRYSISGNSWTYVASLPAILGRGISLVSAGSGDYLFAYRGESKEFFRYSISENIWMPMATTPGSISYGASLVYPGSGNYIYGTRGGNTTDFYRYSTSVFFSSGSFTSSVQDTGINTGLTNLSYGATANGQTLTMDVRAGNTATPDGTWTSWLTNLSNGGDVSSLVGKRYVQYKANLATSDGNVTPTLSDASINFNYYPTNQTLTSSVYDTTDAANVLAKLQWTKTLPANTNATFQIRTSADKTTWTDWEGPGGTNATSFADSTGGEAMPSNFGAVGSNRYLQYKVNLTSDGASTPILSDVSLQYVVNAPPTAQDASATQANAGDQVTFDYAIKDVDTSTGTYTPNFVTPSFQYSLDSGSTWHDIADNAYTYNATPLLGQITDTNSDGKQDNKVLGGSLLTYSINWNAQKQLGLATDVSTAKVRVNITDNEPANSLATSATSDFSLRTNSLSALSVSQSADPATLGKVIVSYTNAIQSTIQANTQIVLQYWNGTSWVVASTLTGDSGANIGSGARQIVWNAGQDFAGQFTQTAKIRLVASYGGTDQILTSSDYQLDTKLPVQTGIKVNLQTEELTLNQLQDNSAYDLYLSTGGGFPDTPQFPNAQNLTYPYTFSYAPLAGIDVNGTVSLKLVDHFGNVSLPFSYITPPKPESVIYFDISNASENTYTEFLTWKPLAGSNLQYQICRASVTDGTLVIDPSTLSYDTCYAVADIANNFYMDRNLDTTKHYYYRVYTQNTLDGSLSNFSNLVDDTPNGNGSSDSIPPALYEVSLDENVDVTATSITINWKANEISNSGLGFTSQADYELSQYNLERINYDPHMIQAGDLHTYTLTGLEPGTTYYLRPRSNDILGNQGVLGNWGQDNAIITVRTKDGPAIKRFTIKETTNNSVTLTWSTTTPANSFIYYSQVKAGGQLVIADENVPNENSGVIKDVSHYVLIHELKIPNLKTGEKYYFSLKSAGANGNFAIENNAGNYYEFTTDQDLAKPIITFDDAHQPLFKTSSQAGVQWVTDQPTTTVFRYKKRSDTDYQDAAVDLNLYDSSHYLFLQNLEPYTNYEFIIGGSDINGNDADEVSGGFRTEKQPELDHDPLATINHIVIPKGNLSDTNAVVTFTTDQAALCLAELSVSQGSYTNPVIIQEDGYDANENYTTSHTLRFINLIFSTPYYFRLTCHDNLVDDQGDFAYLTSDETSFSTTEKLYTAAGAGALGDAVAPVISSVQTGTLTGESATIAWKTDEVANSLVKFGLTDTMMDQVAGDALALSTDAYTTIHEVIVSRLIPGTKYFFSALSTDKSGNIAESSISSFVTRLLSAVSSIHTVSKQIGEVTVTWKTSNPTTSFVDYGDSELYGNRKESSALTTDHEIVLSKLVSGIEYHFRVGGTDKDKNLYTSSDSTFSPKAPPVLSHINIDTVTERSAEVSFSTDILTDALVIYQNIDNPDDSGSQGKPGLSQNHTVTLSKLSPGSRYTITIQARDESGNQSEDTSQRFETTADNNPPTLEQVKINTALTQDDKVQTLITFFTDELATASIKYREGAQGEERELIITRDPSTTHTAVLLSFNSGSVYYVRIHVADIFNNGSDSEDYVVLTPKRSENVVQVIVKNFNDIFSWAKR